MAMLGEQYEQTIAEMLQKQSVNDDSILDHPSQLHPPQIHLDEAQEHESTQLGDRLQHELDILTAYQSKSRMAADSQRTRERRELEVTLLRIYVLCTYTNLKADLTLSSICFHWFLIGHIVSGACVSA